MIIGVCGLIGSGKGTIGDILVKDYNFQKISFADKLKDAVAELFDWDRELLEGDTVESREWRNQPDDFWTRETGNVVTPRLVLQLFGTECMRNGFYDGIWISFVKKKILENPEINYVITDVRFPNEISLLNEIGGEVWWVRRGNLPDWFVNYRDNQKIPENIHPSEWEWARSSFNFIIENDKSINDLKNQVASRLVSNEPLPFEEFSGN